MPVPDNEDDATRKVFKADPDASGTRLDQWLATMLAPDVSRSRVQALIRGGQVEIDGTTVIEPKRKLAGGESATLRLPEPEPAAPRAQPIPLNILFEDEHLIVIDKPAGMVVHPGAGNAEGTLVNALIHHCGNTLSGIGGVRRPGIVHRLDKDTSGVLVVAKTDAAHKALSDAFADHGASGDLERAYLALVWGVPESASGRIEAPLGRATGDRTLRAVVPAGRADARRAATNYRVLERFGPRGAPVASLVECRLETGRTHQIRVHMAHIGHPLLGDRDYGRGFATKAYLLPEGIAATLRDLNRQALHAQTLAFRHPVRDAVMQFRSPPPSDLAELLTRLRDWGPES